MNTRWLRLAMAIVAIGCAVIVWQIVVLLGETSSPRGLKIGAIGVAVLGGTVAAMLTFAPARVLQRLIDRAESLLAVVRSADTIESRRLGRTLMGIGVIAFAAIVGRLLWTPDDPSDDDQMAFLQTAAEVSKSGGPGQLIADLYGGRFAEANRHPLYIALLSLRPTLEFGRGLSVVLGAITLLTLTFVTARRRGTLIAGVFCCLLGTNLAMGQFSTRVVCDVLMVLWGGLIFLTASRRGPGGMWLRPLAIGGLLGLAYLTKGTGLLMLVGVLIWRLTMWAAPFLNRRLSTSHEGQSTPDVALASQPSTLDSKHSRLTQTMRWNVIAPPLLIVLAWTIVASPLLVRNSRMYGKAFYNVNSWLLFVDEYEDPIPLSRQVTVGQAARAYWEAHTLTDVIQREVTGIVWETFMLLRLLGPYPLEDSRVLFGLALALCAAMGIIAAPRQEHGLAVIWTILLVGVFAWYVPIAAGERFLLPLLAPILTSASEGLVRLFSQIRPSRVHHGGAKARS